MRLTGLFSVLLLAAAPAALAQTSASPPPASALAPAGSVRDLVRGVNVPFEQFTMPNGLRVIVHTDRKAPVVAVATWYNVGSKDEAKGKTGFAHLFEHIMLFNGTENVANLTEVLRNVGATDWNGTTWFDRTNYFETVPTPALERALFLESERMGHLLGALTQERLDNQRGVVQNEKRQNDNNPFGLVQYAMLEALFPEGHPYRHSTIGSMADLDAATLEDVRTWFRENYGPNNAVLVLAGDIDARSARPLVQRYFGHIRRGPQNVPAAAPVPTLKATVTATMRDRVANTRLYRTWAVPGRADAATVPLDVAASILGGLASSRLDNELVRGEQTAVAVSAGLQSHQRVGMFQVTVDVKPGADADAVGRRLDAIIADFIARGPSADEVQRASMRTVSQQVLALEQVGGFSGKTVALAEGALYHDDPGFFRKRLDAYAGVTPQAVRSAAQRWLSRPVYALRVEPGAREAYAEAAPAAPRPAAAPTPGGGGACSGPHHA
jgi:predicted Zn-dependent peptidase